MSSGNISKNSVRFEVNNNGAVGRFLMSKSTGLPDKILIEFSVDSFSESVVTRSSSSIMIDREKAKVLSHFFSNAAKEIESWFE